MLSHREITLRNDLAIVELTGRSVFQNAPASGWRDKLLSSCLSDRDSAWQLALS